MVCRQLHQETSLLVYQTNMFSFTAVRTMSVWLKSLKPVQQRSINVVCLPTWYPFYKMHKKQLSGVKRVYHWSKKEKLVKCLTPQEFQGMERYPEESDSELDWY